MIHSDEETVKGKRHYQGYWPPSWTGGKHWGLTSQKQWPTRGEARTDQQNKPPHVIYDLTAVNNYAQKTLSKLSTASHTSIKESRVINTKACTQRKNA